MIKLEIPREDEPHLDLVDKLTELAIAHQVKTSSSLKKAILLDGTTRFEGLDKIAAYLEETKQELQKWWYCAC